MSKKNLIVLVGATGVGKTDLSIEIAQWLKAPIVSSDSRQLYRQMNIGTAVPSKQQLDAVKHYFIHSHDVTDLYTSGRYERDVLKLLDQLFQTTDNVLLVGGSGLYIDAVCNGIDAVPSTNVKLRDELINQLNTKGLDSLLEELKISDPDFYDVVDKDNPNRVMRALEVIRETGKTYTSFRQGEGKKRDFNIIKIGIQRPREDLYARINQRVDIMMKEGLLKEATSLYNMRHCNALQTVGYREFFDYIDGLTTLDQAIELLKRNTRRYAKRQTTWFGRYSDISWFSPDSLSDIKDFLSDKFHTVQSTVDKYISHGIKAVMIAVQDIYGYIDEDKQKQIARMMNVDISRIKNLMQFNPEFKIMPDNCTIIKVCVGRGCNSRGAGDIVKFFEDVLDVKCGETTNDGKFCLTKCRCVGSCSLGVLVWIGGVRYENMNLEKVKELWMSIV